MKTFLPKLYRKNTEFLPVPHPEYTKMQILGELGCQERIAGFLQELSHSLEISNLVTCHYTHGGYIPMECSKIYSHVDAWSPDMDHSNHLEANNKLFSLSNIQVHHTCPLFSKDQICFIEDNSNFQETLTTKFFQTAVLVCPSRLEVVWQYTHNKYQWEDTGYSVYVELSLQEKFNSEFQVKNNTVTFDNLLHFCMIVKNGGSQLEQMLTQNAPYFDRWTILDTGSTDNTLEIIDRVLKNKSGVLYRGDFVDFSTTRNQCLEYAEKQHAVPCKYFIMLDDTYVIQGKLRDFLNEVRGDQYADSFSLFVSSNDCKYVSNRIIKSGTGLRYKYRIHEVLEDRGNINVVIPHEVVSILDARFDYMEKRTMERKQKDIEWLTEEIRDNPNEPRHYYYMAQTLMLLEKYEDAYIYFAKRAEFRNSGFIQERVDAVFEMARLANFKLNRPWSECLILYESAFQIDPSRPESLYYIGIHHFLENNYKLAYTYFKRAFEIGFPEHCQHSLKPTLSFYFVPKFLAKICFFVNDYTLGYQAVQFFLQHNPPTADNWNEIISWQNIYKQLLSAQSAVSAPVVVDEKYLDKKPICLMVVDGGFCKWTGSDILSRGVGGSETCMIELAQNIQSLGQFQVVLFCQCSQEMVFNGVEYRDLSKLYTFIHSHFIHTCIVSRYTEYLAPLSKNLNIENLYLILHDLMLPETVIVQERLKRIFCLSDWHSQYFREMFPPLAPLVETFSYGIDLSLFGLNLENKIPHSFIYSSFPERGLLPLLQCWPRILYKYPDATLHIFCNMDNEWSNKHYFKDMQEIRRLFNLKMSGITNHGWVKKSVLAEYWKKSAYWFYPCTFQETFCLTALEAAASKTMVITNDLAALQNTAHSDRALVIPGNPMSMEWQEKALETLFAHSESFEKVEKNYRWAQNLSWSDRGYKLNQLFLQEKMEIRGMRNWTNGIPSEAEKVAFQKVLTEELCVSGLSEIRILEIGVWSGLSFISLIQTVQNAYKLPVEATAMDAWENYREDGELKTVVEWGIESSFDKNIRQMGLWNCVRKLKGKSVDLLRKALQENDVYDFIYVNGSHKALDCFADLILSWEILKPGGIMGIDDYLFSSEESITMKQGIDQFLKMTPHELLFKGYRVFIKKPIVQKFC